MIKSRLFKVDEERLRKDIESFKAIYEIDPILECNKATVELWLKYYDYKSQEKNMLAAKYCGYDIMYNDKLEVGVIVLK